ncbi:16S rRNA (guanine(527)-N(7))-methyltransferase RsmG [Treponema sp.]|uniref:16S rRNA (guanine(527)-N(7))-methyltransferase RsmG n=1 Tax=Treponema sp. TaxID=166 RepID=UPI00257A6DD6|nr:16S rRNA (guanine(527)-N(7))-methyltransferase RsmG [Treponema sp.]MBE6354533.1 16S rRNA (guanine(527)-N(7))-methyltransferase RsmG [Treponema sp.]
MNEKLIQGCAKLGLNLSQVQFEQLETYINAVLDFNKTYNLMKADNADELAVNHVLDSLAAVPHIASLIDSSSKIGDIGSGGGCPGIPLAVAFPENSFTLVERMEKRCVFLESAVRKMNLKNVKILCSQADSVEKEIFDLEVFRAFHPFDKKIVKLLFGMLKKGGHLAAYKARLEKINAEMAEVQVMVPDYKVINLTVPFLEDHERNLVVIKK